MTRPKLNSALLTRDQPIAKFIWILSIVSINWHAAT